jgi:glutamate dehydrogenase/leucine dehydrogenase
VGQEKNFTLEGSTMTVQGFGNVGSHLGHPLEDGRVDHRRRRPLGLPLQPRGFQPHKLQDYVKKTGSIAGYPAGKAITRDEFFKVKADIFAPCALENQVGEAEAKALQVKLVAEGANGPLAPEGEKILIDRGIDILPDVLANAGGVTVSYFEWVQNKRSESWTLEEVDERLEKAMRRAWREANDLARQKKCSLRVAAYGVALERIKKVYEEREIFP